MAKRTSALFSNFTNLFDRSSSKVRCCLPAIEARAKINEQLSIIVTHCDAQMQEPDEEVRHREFQAPLWSQQGNYVQVWSRKT
jgi:hypothetical protein